MKFPNFLRRLSFLGLLVIVACSTVSASTGARTATWLGSVRNRDELLSSRRLHAPAKFKEEQNSEKALISVHDSRITFAKPGIVFFSYHQDAIHSFGYFTLEAQLDGQFLTKELLKTTDSKWDGISTAGVVPVTSSSNLSFSFDTSRNGALTRFDNGRWGLASALWISSAARAHVIRAETTNAASLRNVGGRFLFSVKSNYSPFGEKIRQLKTGHFGFAEDGVIHFNFHQDIKHRSAGVKLRASLTDRDGQHTILANEEQEDAASRWDGLSVSGSTAVRKGDSLLSFDLDNINARINSIDNGVWGVLSLVWLPNDIAWSSGPVSIQSDSLSGAAFGVVQFAAARTSPRHAPLIVGKEYVFFRRAGKVVFDLHIAADSACPHYSYISAHIDGSVVALELASAPTPQGQFDGLSLSGAISGKQGDELRFVATCHGGYFRKVRSGSASFMFLPDM